MKRSCVVISCLMASMGLYAQSQNDYMDADAVNGAADYYFQWIIILIGVVLALFILAHLLNVYFKAKDWYNGNSSKKIKSKDEEYLSRATFNVEITIKCKNRLLSVYGYQMDGCKILCSNLFLGYAKMSQSGDIEVFIDGEPTRSFRSHIFSEKDLSKIGSLSKDWKQFEISTIKDDCNEDEIEDTYNYKFEIKGLFDANKLEIGTYLEKNEHGVHGIKSKIYYIPEIIYYDGIIQEPVKQ